MEEKELMEKIKLIICGGEGINPKTVFTRTRQRPVREARQIIAYFCRKYIKDSYNKPLPWDAIGAFIGLSHSNTLQAVDAIDGWIATDKNFREKMAEYDKKIDGLKGLYTLSVAILLQEKIRADMDEIKKDYDLLTDIVKKLTPNVVS